VWQSGLPAAEALLKKATPQEEKPKTSVTSNTTKVFIFIRLPKTLFCLVRDHMT
jgi:hypothetical protein